MAEDRARSFMERYVIARAPHFRAGPAEVEDMHACALLAKSAYRHIANVARTAEPEAYQLTEGGFVATGPIGPSGATGPIGPSGPPSQQGHYGHLVNKPGLLVTKTAPVNPPVPNRSVWRGFRFLG